MPKVKQSQFSTKKGDAKEKFLDRVQDMINDLNSTNGANDKIEFIQKYPKLKDFIKIVYHPLKPFHVTSANIAKFAKNSKSKTVQPVVYNDITELLNALADHDISGHEALASVMWWVNMYPQHANLIYLIVDKDLKIRMGAKQINKAFPKLIPQFNVALGYPAEKYPKALKSGKWKISHKLDGVRCISVVTSTGEVAFYSRQGNQFFTLDKVAAQIKNTVVPLFPNGVVLDGEVCVIQSDGRENFKGVMKEIRKKDHTMSKPRYLLFDCLTPEEFWEGTGTRLFSERLNDLERINGKTLKVSEITVIDQIDYTPQRLDEMNEVAEKYGWEGLIVRKDGIYEGKRTSRVLKVKKFETEEYTVMDVEFGPFQAKNDSTGLTETIETLVSVSILHKNYPVSVGSGFSLKERKQFYKDSKKIKGKIISVRYFEETTDSTGAVSLRFPTFKGLYGKTRTF